MLNRYRWERFVVLSLSTCGLVLTEMLLYDQFVENLLDYVIKNAIFRYNGVNMIVFQLISMPLISIS